MENIFNVGETILLDGKPLCLVTRAGVEDWIEKGIRPFHRPLPGPVREWGKGHHAPSDREPACVGGDGKLARAARFH